MKFIGKGSLLSSIPVGTVNLDPENDFDITFRVVNHLSDSFSSIDALFRGANKLMITISNEKRGMMSLKTVGTLTWKACETCRHKDICFEPSIYQESGTSNVGCADYLSNEESEE